MTINPASHNLLRASAKVLPVLSRSLRDELSGTEESADLEESTESMEKANAAKQALQHSEDLLDEALSESFPASDPTADFYVIRTVEAPDATESMLDEALAETFPASDPVAISITVRGVTIMSL